MDYGKEFEKYATRHHGVNSNYYNQIISSMNPLGMTPNIIEERQMNIAIFDVFSRLMMDRIIFLGTAINDQVANIIQAQLLFLESTDASKDIQIYINSPGGVFMQVWVYTTRCNLSNQTWLQYVREWQLRWELFFFAQGRKGNEAVCLIPGL